MHRGSLVSDYRKHCDADMADYLWFVYMSASYFQRERKHTCKCLESSVVGAVVEIVSRLESCCYVEERWLRTRKSMARQHSLTQ